MIKNTSIIYNKELFCSITALIDSSMSPDNFLFFDIETTGLEAKSSVLYLIGYLSIKNDSLILTQLFAESFVEQDLLVSEFQKELDEYKYVVHFNGQTFDIPYLEFKGSHFDNNISFDIYRELKPLKSFLGLNSMKQKILEKYCGLNRDDIYDGGELIDFYIRYIAASKIKSLNDSKPNSFAPVMNSGLPYLGNSDSENLKKSLLLHNYEDVEGMMTVATLLALIPENISKICDLNIGAEPNQNSIIIEISLKNTAFLSIFNRAYSKSNTFDYVFFKDIIDYRYDNGCFRFTLYKHSGTLLQFFDNYKDYFYIPTEDKVIPKSIGNFMDKSLREKATPENCHISHQDTYIPLSVREETKPKKSSKVPESPMNIHFFRKSYNSVVQYVSEKEFNNISGKELISMLFKLIK